MAGEIDRLVANSTAHHAKKGAVSTVVEATGFDHDGGFWWVRTHSVIRGKDFYEVLHSVQSAAI